MRRLAASLVSSCVLLSLTLGAGCNRRVFQFVENSCDSTIPVDLQIPTQKAADILIVVDNSGSMQEEQDELVANFVNLDETECPLTNLDAIPEQFKNPAPALYEAGGPLSKCGFIQILAAFENDFRVGVITTDVGLCDNRFGQAPDALDWGFRPQRGCLQPDGPTRAGHNLFMSRADLTDPDRKNLAARFEDTLGNIRTFGTGFERGLDAIEIFLDPESTRAPACAGDLETFRRPDAQLVIITLTDEEDCSHADGAFGFLDENGSGDSQVICGDNPQLADRDVTTRCYDQLDKLAPTQRYVDAVRRADPSAKIAVIAGLVPDSAAAGGFEASGCFPSSDPAGAPVVECWESGGNSGLAGPGEMCGDPPAPEVAEARDGKPCCIADSGSRYLDFARAFDDGQRKSFLLDSICKASFLDTMIDIAAFIAATNFVELVEPPQDGLVLVSLVNDGGEEVPVARIDREACATSSGWYLEGDRTVVFCQDAIPGPGDEVKIRAKGRAETDACAAASE